MKKFVVSFGNRTKYSGCNRDSWPLRTEDLHRQQCKEVLGETTKTGMQKIESKFGVRCSVLLGLPYYDPIRFVAIDTMHNLFLGTGKKMFKLWVESGILTPQHMLEIEDKIHCFKVPPDVGRITIYSPVDFRTATPSVLVAFCACIHCFLNASSQERILLQLICCSLPFAVEQIYGEELTCIFICT